jgi:hypothetical protein
MSNKYKDLAPGWHIAESMLSMPIGASQPTSAARSCLGSLLWMVSIIQSCTKTSRPFNQLVAVLLVFTLLSPSVRAEGFHVRSADSRLVDSVYMLDARIDYRFSDPTLEALQNGVPLIVLVDIEVEQVRKWWFNKTIAELQQGYLLLYHALTEKYIINNLNSGVQENYDSLGSALAALGRINDLPLLDANLVKMNEQYQVNLQTYLDLEALPAPMRPIAYISSQWRLESDWYQWPLKP